MPRLSSIEIHNKIRDIDERIAAASDQFNSSEGDERARIHDSICELNGERRALNDRLQDVLEAEDAMRRDGGVPLTSQPARNATELDVAAQFLGARDDFRPQDLLSRAGQMMNLTGFVAQNDALTLAIPTRSSTNIPSNAVELPMGVLDTLSKGTTDANMTYMVPKAFENGADLWQPGQEKKETKESWDEKTMNLFTVAHWMAVSKQAINHYSQLSTVINNDLLYGLRLREHAAALNIDEAEGKKGILKDPDIQIYTAKKGESLYDSARRMKTKSWMATGYQPTHLAVHPMAKEQLDLEKSDNGFYLRLMVDGKVWGLPVVEDVNLYETTGSTGNEKTTYGALMYNNMAATWYTSENNAISIGLTGNQFIRNEYTVLAEGEHGISIQRPKSFVYLKDAVNKAA